MASISRACAAFAIAAVLAQPTMVLAAAKVTTERIPLPGAQETPPAGLFLQLDDDGEGQGPTAQDAPVREKAPQTTDTSHPLPQIHYGADGLPKPVARIRAQILDAALSGDLEALRPVLESNEMPPTLALTDIEDPIDYLKQASGDKAGREILALLSEILEAGWVHVDEGTPQEMYIWPYFARYPLNSLSPSQEVELYRILTANDVEEMRDFGAYIFYRVGIGPDGTWHYFVAGD
ncbi:hypothetical protein [Breoghania sp.]|uniref:hypothetical protein n=1 Tax=Breoghania sp. TaxID=2065378 RepID=UPI002AAC3E78|nr:hypothetical protein [Breoghania sp.]